jgi:HD superfamily phosphohydrolase
LNANDNQDFFANDYVGSSSRPLGRKKEKMRRKQTSENNQALDSIAEDNSEILNTLKNSQLHREEVFAKMKEDGNTRYQLLMLKAENERKKLELQQERQEKEFMEKDLNSIEDLVEREYFQCKKKEILQKRQRESEMCGFSNQRGYEGGGYFPDDLLEY